MDKLTIIDVAKKAGVSKSTVSRVINNKKNVNKKTREKVAKIIEELNYFPNSSARSLVTKKTNNIGLIVPEITDSFFLEYIKGIEAVGTEENYNIIFLSSHWNLNQEKKFIKFFTEEKVDGLVIISGEVLSENYINFLNKEKLPLVIVDRKLENSSVPTINVNNYDAFYKMTEYFFNNGHKRIAFVRGNDNLIAAKERLRGYKKFMNEKGYLNLDLNKFIYKGDFSIESGYTATKDIITTMNNFTAVLYSNDKMAVGGLQYLKDKGIKVPDKISIAGCDNINELKFIKPGLTTLNQPRYKMGYKAMRLLIDIIENNRKEYFEKIVFEMDLIKRDSVKRYINN